MEPPLLCFSLAGLGRALAPRGSPRNESSLQKREWRVQLGMLGRNPILYLPPGTPFWILMPLDKAMNPAAYELSCPGTAWQRIALTAVVKTGDQQACLWKLQRPLACLLYAPDSDWRGTQRE